MLDYSRVLGLAICLFVAVQASLTQLNGWRKNVGAFCHNDTSHGVPNLYPIDESAARFVSKVENGSLYQIGAGEDQVWLIHVYGNTGYDYGFAYGTLLREQIGKVLPRAWAHFEQQIIDGLKDLKLPKWFVDLVVDKGLAFALDFQNALVEKYIDREIYAEMKGIADAAQIDYGTVRRLHMLGEITRGKAANVDQCLHHSRYSSQVVVRSSVSGARLHSAAKPCNYVPWTGTPMVACKTIQ